MPKYDIADVFYLDTNLTLPDDFDAGKQVSSVLDVSSYVNPIGQGRSKGTGLAIYKVQFTFSDSSGNRPVTGSQSAGFRAGLLAGYDTTQAAVAATDLSTNQLSGSNDLMVAGVDFYGPSATTAISNSYPPTGTDMEFMSPSTEVPYVVVRDSIGLVAVSSVNINLAMKVGVRLSCAIITLNQATLNQLLRTQTV